MDVQRRVEDERGGGRVSFVGSKRTAKWLLVGLIIFGWAHFLFGPQGLVRQRQRTDDVEKLRAAHARELQINASLEARIERLATDDLEIERALRIELDYQRPGETVYIIPSIEDELLRESSPFDEP